MRLKYLPLLLFAFGLSSFSLAPMHSQLDCSSVHEGVFRYGTAYNNYKIKIKGDKHVEFHPKGKIISSIEWVNDCEFNTTAIKSTVPNLGVKPGDVLNIKINSINDHKISYTATSKGQSWEGNMIKIK